MIQHLFQAYLIGYLYWVAFPLGALAILMMYRLTGGEWGEVTEGYLEAAVGTLPGFALFFVPILAGAGLIYSWAQPGTRELLHGGNRIYLSQVFFAVRAVVYFAGWIFLSRAVLRKGSPNIGRISAGGLIFYGLSISFASFDWQMSVNPAWYSTVYGMLFGVGELLQAWAGVLLVLTAQSERFDVKKPKVQRDLTNLLLAYVMVWAYLSFVQYLIIWSGNLPEEVNWYTTRITGGWKVLAVSLWVLQFALPFSALLFRSLKQRSHWVFVLGGIVLAARLVEQYWTIEPAFSPGRFTFNPWCILTVLGLGAVWIRSFRRELLRKELARV